MLCAIGNPMRELTPGTNVNAFILTQVVDNALTIPKLSVRRDGAIGVFLLQPDNTLKWQPIVTGASDALRVEVLSGLADGDAVAPAIGAGAEERREGYAVSPITAVRSPVKFCGKPERYRLPRLRLIPVHISG